MDTLEELRNNMFKRVTTDNNTMEDKKRVITTRTRQKTRKSLFERYMKEI